MNKLEKQIIEGVRLTARASKTMHSTAHLTHSKAPLVTKPTTDTSTVNGDQFMCVKHGIDYRICCEDCQDRYQEFKKLFDKIWYKKQNGEI